MGTADLAAAVAVPVLTLVNRRTQIGYFRKCSQIDLDCESVGGRIAVKVSCRTNRENVVAGPKGRESAGHRKTGLVTEVDKRNPFEGSGNKALRKEL